MTTADFRNILAKPIEDIAPPPQFPIGSYQMRIKGHEMVESGEKKTPGVRFTCIPFSAGEDVDPATLKEFGPLGDKEIRITFWVTEDSAYRLKEFLENDVGLSGPTLESLIPQATNQVFGGYVSHRMSKDNRLFAEVNKTFKAA